MQIDQPQITTVAAYIAQFPTSVRQQLEIVRSAIREVVPEAEETIGYAMPTYKLNGNLVHFAGYQKHIGFYPGSSGIRTFEQDLSSYKWAKGSVQFPLHSPMPVELIQKITLFRAEENRKKKAKTSK